MSTTRYLLSILTLTLLGMAMSTPASAQTPVPDSEKEAILTDLTQGYDDWNAVEINGKLIVDALPVSPSIKICMQRDRSLLISARVPVMGEVFRIECDTTEIAIYNKHKKTYVKADMRTLLKKSAASLGNLQDLLLGRMFLMGKGTLLPSDVQLIDIFADDDDDTLFAVMPKDDGSIDGIRYGFEAFTSGGISTAGFNLEGNIATLFADYYPDNRGTDIDLTVTIPLKNKEVHATLDLQTPKETDEFYEPFVPSSKYRQLEPRDLLKVFKF